MAAIGLVAAACGGGGSQEADGTAAVAAPGGESDAAVVVIPVRQAGAEAIVRGLLGKGALGLVTTHDLALADSVAALGPEARNVHFEDRLDGDGLSVDYTPQPGLGTRSNPPLAPRRRPGS
jgi:hypothetical protein